MLLTNSCLQKQKQKQIPKMKYLPSAKKKLNNLKINVIDIFLEQNKVAGMQRKYEKI